jgi:hypothetical protein
LGVTKGRNHWEDLGICEDNIKMDLREIGSDGANWIRQARVRVQLRALVNTIENLRVP